MRGLCPWVRLGLWGTTTWVRDPTRVFPADGAQTSRAGAFPRERASSEPRAAGDLRSLPRPVVT